MVCPNLVCCLSRLHSPQDVFVSAALNYEWPSLFLPYNSTKEQENKAQQEKRSHGNGENGDNPPGHFILCWVMCQGTQSWCRQGMQAVLIPVCASLPSQHTWAGVPVPQSQSQSGEHPCSACMAMELLELGVPYP